MFYFDVKFRCIDLTYAMWSYRHTFELIGPGLGAHDINILKGGYLSHFIVNLEKIQLTTSQFGWNHLIERTCKIVS